LCWVPHTQLVNIRHSHGHVGYQEGLHHSYTPQHWEPSYAHNNCTYHQFSAPPSPCTSIASHCTSTLSSLHGWDGAARSPPAQHRRQPQPHSRSDDSDAIPGLQLATPYSDSLPSVSQQASPVVYSQQPQQQQQQHLHSDDVIPGLNLVTPYSESASSVSQEASPAAYSQHSHAHSHSHSDDAIPGLHLVTPYSPSSGSVPSSPALAPELTTTTTTRPQEDLVGRRASVSGAPKRRRVTRAVQPLACFFCRGRKIACGPPTSTRSGDRTCEYVVTRQLTLPLRKKNFILYCTPKLAFLSSIHLLSSLSVAPTWPPRQRRHRCCPLFLSLIFEFFFSRPIFHSFGPCAPWC
jgi:hypothetical protein